MTLPERVAQAIQMAPHLSQRRLRFETHDGHVVIRGTVSSYFQKQMAQEALRNLEGVRAIDNELEVIWTDEPPVIA